MSMVSIDMSDAVPLIGGVASLTLYRRQPGHFTSATGVGPGGVWTERQARTVPITGSLQPAGRREELLLEGNRAADMRVLFTSQKLQTVKDPGGAGADRLFVDGDWFECATAEDWTFAGLSNYFRAVFVRLRAQDPPPVQS